jgi:hypothetical protein
MTMSVSVREFRAVARRDATAQGVAARIALQA